MVTSDASGVAPTLLAGPGEIDAAWLTSVLRHAGHDATVTGFTLAPIGAGNVSDTVRVALSYDAPIDAPRSLVCKFAASGADAHAHGISSGSYRREVESYRMIGAACRTPRVYWVDGGADAINLVLADLTKTARAGDQITGCGPREAEAVVSELAHLHHAFPLADAPSWAMTMATTADYWTAAIDRALPVIRPAVAERLTAEEMTVVEAAGEVARAWYTLPLARATLTHGDPRVDNILFLDGPDGCEAVLIDWQLTGRRNPMHDIGYFLSGSVSIEDRRAHEHDLLARYADEFGPGYPAAEIANDYRLHLLSGLMTTIAAYGLIPLTPAVDRLLLTLLRRNAAAAADWHSIAALIDRQRR